MSEFALHTYSSQVSIAYPSQLEYVDVSTASYHIYMINKIKRLSFMENSIKILGNHVEIQIQHGVTLIDKIETVKIPLFKDAISYEFEGDKILIIKDRHDGGLKLDILMLYTSYSRERLNCEVVYVGQSYGEKGNRNALERLKSHETLQKVMAEVMYGEINSEIAITLWEFTPRLITSIDGRNDFLVTGEEEMYHFQNVLSAPPLFVDNQIINVTEAALINYFKPNYNNMFKNNFPDIKHKGYSFYYDYDYNAITVELDPSCVNIKIYSENTNYSQFSPIEYMLNSEEKRKSMFIL